MVKNLVLALTLATGPFGSGASASLSGDDWTKAIAALQAALASGKDAEIEQAAAKVASDNSPRAVEFLLKILHKAQPPGPYWAVIGGLSKITDATAQDAIATEILKGKSPELRRDLIMAFRLCEAADAVGPLMRILKEGTPELQVSAMDELVDRGHLLAVPVAIEIAEKDPREEHELTRRCFKAIRALVREEPTGGPVTWRTWWENKKRDLTPDSDTPRVKRPISSTVVESIRRSRATEAEDLKKLSKEEIVVVQGASDSVEDALYRLGVKHTLIGRERLERSEDLGFGKCIAVFSNCGTGDWPPKEIERIKQFVYDGGYLCVTDLGMLTVVKLAFPGFLEFGKGSFTQMTVEILPWRGSTGHPFLRGVDLPLKDGTAKNDEKRLTWQLDNDTRPIGYDSKKVMALIESPELLNKGKPSALSVVFSPYQDTRATQDVIAMGGVYEDFQRTGGGKVLCLASHFKKQRSSEDGFILQNLLINFLIEAKDRAAMREAAKKSEPKKSDKKPEKKQ